MRGGLIALALTISGCAGASRPLSLQPAADLDEASYKDVLKRWTKKDEVFDGLFSVMYANATFHSPELRKAFLLRFPESYGRGSDEARRLTLADPEAESHWEFFLSASTSNQRWNDLARPDSIWRVTLRADGGPEVDAIVRLIPLNANLRVFYPYLTPFATGYGLKFPLVTPEGTPTIGPETKTVVLRVSSALGAAEMVWQLTPVRSKSTPVAGL